MGKEKPLIIDEIGYNNKNLDDSIKRLIRGNSYRNLSTVWITPTRGNLKPKVVSSWMSLQRPMNQPFLGPIFIENDEVGCAYQKAFELILDNPNLKDFKYLLTVEEDNLPPADGLLKLYESISQGYDCVAGLYWTKSNSTSEAYSQPMIYGDPKILPRNFVPQIPEVNKLQHCNGLGMGFNLWSLDSFRKKLKDMPRPWFRTVQDKDQQFTQDLFFYNNAAGYGFKVACDTRVLVGHLDIHTGMVW